MSATSDPKQHKDVKDLLKQLGRERHVKRTQQQEEQKTTSTFESQEENKYEHPEQQEQELSRQRGLSEMHIETHMRGENPEVEVAWPQDDDDFGRCFALLEKNPSWRARMQEMQAYGPVWHEIAAKLAWPRLERLYKDILSARELQQRAIEEAGLMAAAEEDVVVDVDEDDDDKGSNNQDLLYRMFFGDDDENDQRLVELRDKVTGATPLQKARNAFNREIDRLQEGGRDEWQRLNPDAVKLRRFDAKRYANDGVDHRKQEKRLYAEGDKKFFLGRILAVHHKKPPVSNLGLKKKIAATGAAAFSNGNKSAKNMSTSLSSSSSSGPRIATLSSLPKATSAQPKNPFDFFGLGSLQSN